MKFELDITNKHLLFLVLLAVLVAGINYAAADWPTVGHDVGDIGAGTFGEAGNYIFPSGSSIGIGTDPDNILDIEFNDLGGKGITVRNTNPAGNAMLVAKNDLGDEYFALSKTGSDFGFGGDATLWNSDSTNIRIFTNSEEVMRITSNGGVIIGNAFMGTAVPSSGDLIISGNVGIGTYDPDAKLEIDGNIIVQGTNNQFAGATSTVPLAVKSTQNELGIYIDQGGAGKRGFMSLYMSHDDYAGIQVMNNAGSYGDLYLLPFGGTVAMGDSVGIGTATPAAGYTLDVEGKVQATAFDTGDITFRDQDTQEILWRMFEDEDGLYLENMATGKVYRFVLEEVK